MKSVKFTILINLIEYNKHDGKVFANNAKQEWYRCSMVNKMVKEHDYIQECNDLKHKVRDLQDELSKKQKE